MTVQATKKDFIDVAGRRLAFTRAGQGAPVALLHGIPTHGYLWRHVAPKLAANGLEVVTVDLLGYGASDKPADADLGIAAQARLLAEAFHELDWSGGTIVGHDIGGGVAQLIAVAHPHLVNRLVLVDSIAYDSFPEPGIARLKDPAWDAILGAPDFDLRKGLTKAFMRGMVQAERVTNDLIAAYETPFHGVAGRAAYLRAARALRTEELSSRMAEVERLQIPTLIIWGEKDAFQPMDCGKRLAAAMPHARFEVIDRAGHFLPEDAPEPLADLIFDFLRS